MILAHLGCTLCVSRVRMSREIRGRFHTPFAQPVADIVQCGLSGRNVLRRNYLGPHARASHRKLLILLVLLVWLAALDDFRNWLIREAA